MAKWQRYRVGNVQKSKIEGKPSSVFLSRSGLERLIELYAKLPPEAKGLYLNLESKKFQLDNLNEGVEAGRLNEQTAEKIRADINKMPDFVLFDIVSLSKTDA